MQVKSTKRNLSILLALVFLSSMLSITPAYAAVNSSFFSSFESTDSAAITSSNSIVADGITAQSLGSYIGAGGSSGGGTVRLDGDLMKCVSAITASAGTNGSSSEDVTKLADNDSGSKWCYTPSTAFTSDQVWARYQMAQGYIATTYCFVGAADNSSYAARRPSAWKVQGSNNGSSWTTLHQVTTGGFPTANGGVVTYTFENSTPYSYYRLTIDSINNGSTSAGMFQIADWSIGTGSGGQVEPPIGPVTGSMTTSVVSPSIKWNTIGGNGWTGSRALGVAAKHTKSGRVSGKSKIYEFSPGNEISVGPTTDLSYMIAPSFNEKANAENFEFQHYPSQHVSIDLHFTDGTYLSELNCYDSHGVKMDPQSQFEGRCMWEGMWNKVLARIGDVANGKLIDQILVYYDNIDGDEGWSFEAFVDDIRITAQRSDDPTAQSFDAAFNSAGEIIHPSELTDIRRGSNSSEGTFSRGNQGADVCAPMGADFWAASTKSSGNDPYEWQVANNSSVNKPYLRHFSSNHRASRWIGDCNNFQFLPNIASSLTSSTMSQSSRGYAFSHDNEIAKCYYYSVITDNDIRTEMSPTTHGLHVRVTFPSTASYRNILWDSLGTSARQISGFTTADNELSFSVSNSHNASRTEFIYVQLSQAPTSTSTISSMRGASSYSRWDSLNNNQLEIRIGTSYFSVAQAKANCNAEVKSTFDETKAASQLEWDTIMNRTLIKDFAPAGWNGNVNTLPLKTLDGLVTFYSNIYKLDCWPTAQHENTGTAENPVFQYITPYGGGTKDGTFYYNNGFWDVYKATWSTYGLLYPAWSVGGLNGLVSHYLDSGFVPRWVAPTGTNSMVGTSSDIVFGTAAVRGQDFDIQRAYESSVKNATVNNTSNLTYGGRDSLTSALFYGYNAGTGSGSDKLSWGLESYINDWGISQMAKQLGYTDQAAYYAARATNYVNYWNPEQITDVFANKTIPGGWLRQKSAPNATTGVATWASGFNPYAWLNGYTETNAWDMVVTMSDGQGMDNLLKDSGGSLEQRLDDVFTTTASFYGGGYGIIHEGREHSAVKMGQYGHSNQPSHQIPYFYNFTDAPWKTQLYVRDILDRLYTGWEVGYGYCGDEDNGEMSGTAVMSALGFGSTSLGWDDFLLTTPYFPHITITQDNGNVIDIYAPGVSMTNKYIQSMKLDGAPYNKTYISSKDLYGKAYTKLEYVVGAQPSDWGTAADSKPGSLTAPGVTPQPMVDLTKGYTNRGGDSMFNGGGTISSPANLFNNNGGNAGTATLGTGIWFGYKFENPKVVHLYTITSTNNAAQAPRAWTFEGSNDSENWDILDTRTNVTFGFDTRNLSGFTGAAKLKSTMPTMAQALAGGTAWTSTTNTSGGSSATQSTMPFGIINNKAYTYYRVNISEVNSGTTVGVSELEFMGFENPDTAYLAAPKLQKQDDTYCLYGSDAADFSFNLPRIPVADVTLTVSSVDGLFTASRVFKPENFSVAQKMDLKNEMGRITRDMKITITSADPTYNMVYDLVLANYIFEADVTPVIQAGTTVTATAAVTNVSEAANEDVITTIALYNSDNQLVNLASEKLVPVSGETLTLEKSFDIPADSTGYNIKVFFWDKNHVPFIPEYNFSE